MNILRQRLNFINPFLYKNLPTYNSRRCISTVGNSLLEQPTDSITTSTDSTITVAGIKANNMGILTFFNRDSCLCVKLRIPEKPSENETSSYKSGGVIFSHMKRVSEGSRKYDQDSRISVFVPVERLGPLLLISKSNDIAESGITILGSEGSEMFISIPEDNLEGAKIKLTQIKRVDDVQQMIRRSKITGKNVKVTKVRQKREPVDSIFYCKDGDLSLLSSGIRGVLPYLLGWIY